MLKKLFVHEWKDSWKLVALFNAIVIVFTLIGVIAISNGSWRKAIENNGWYMSIFVSYFFLFYFAILLLGLVTNFYFLMRFYKNLYTDQGYLMHTLPVSSHQLILSKAFVMYIWQMISGLVMMVSIVVLVNSFVIGLGEVSLFRELSKLFREIPWGDITPLDVLDCIMIVLIAIGGGIFSIMFGYLAISLGQLAKNHKLLASIGIYFGMQTVLQILSSWIQVGFTMQTARYHIDDISEGLIFAILLLMTILIYAADAGMFAGSNYIMKNKLNLE